MSLFDSSAYCMDCGENTDITADERIDYCGGSKPCRICGRPLDIFGIGDEDMARAIIELHEKFERLAAALQGGSN